MLETLSNQTDNDKPWLFKPGNSLGKGRPKGSKSRLQTSFLDALADDFEANGASAIVQARETNPVGYLRVVAQVIPQDVNVVHKTVFDEMDANDLSRLVAVISEQSARLIDASPSSVVEAQTGIVQTVSEAEIIP